MALLFTILCGAAAICLGYFINYFAKGHFVYSTKAVLDAQTQYIQALDNVDGLESTEQYLYVVLKENQEVPEHISSSLSDFSENIVVFKHAKNNKQYAAKIQNLPDGRKLLVAFDITEISHDFKFMQWLGIASIVFVIIVVFVSYIISIFVVSGTNKIADTARQIINTGDLSRRVEIGSRWDDLSNMAAVLNMLLDRIEELMQGVREVSDNIAHDLRTPLTRMRNQIETLQKEGEEKKKKEYATLLEEADHLLDTFNALLRISRIEAQKQKSQFQNLNLKDIINDVIDFYEPLAEEKSITLQSDLSEASYYGDRDLLFQAFANILDNAIKYTPTGKSVKISLYKQDNKTCISIADKGEGISDAEKKKIFNRFYRGEKSRSSSGTGLGLSLVSAVIALHEGEIVLQDNNPGLKIITHL